MISVRFDTSDFAKQMSNIVDYSEGFLKGAKSAQSVLIDQIGRVTAETLENFIDANARANPSALHHVYEWYATGSPASRLFDIEYQVAGGGLTISSSFRQSSVAKEGASTPFYDKARIMEEGVPVKIKPVRSSVIRFEDNGEEVFTKRPVDVYNPGGEGVQGSFEETFDMFFNNYFSQAFLEISGISEIMNNVSTFSKNLSRARSGASSAGYNVGYRWIASRKGL